MSQTEPEFVISPLQINGNIIDVDSIIKGNDYDGQPATHILIGCRTSLGPEENRQLKSGGCEIQQYFRENVYLCRYTKDNFRLVRRLPFIAWAMNYPDSVVIEPRLKSSISAASFKDHTVNIVLHKDVVRDTDFQDFINELKMKVPIDDSGLRRGLNKVQASIQEQYLDIVSSLDAVLSIQEVHPRALSNNKARDILKVDKAQDVLKSNVSGNGTEFNGTEFKGKGQIIAVADTGFDLGITDDETLIHPAFISRILRIHALGRPDKGDDPDGHGTHVCGSVAGSWTSSVLAPHERAIEAPASEAKLIVQSLWDPKGELGGIPLSLFELFQQTFKEKAMIHTNSWNTCSRDSDQQLPYDDNSFQIDKFVWENDRQIICFSAGNEGADKLSEGEVTHPMIGSEAAAKNCITVGASENDRPNIPCTYKDLWNCFRAEPIRSYRIAENPRRVAAISSRGPTVEGRYKPDLVAPGTCILSARSQRMGRYTVPQFLKILDHMALQHHFGYDDYSMLSNGTSMATPLVASCAAVIREALLKIWKSDASAALIKALLINGAELLEDQYETAGRRPSINNSSGFGRVNLQNSVQPIIECEGIHAGFGEGTLKEKDKENKFTIPIPNHPPEKRTTLKITLVWSDHPGSDLTNDLDLIVRYPAGIEHHGNMGTSDQFDRVNNVEQVLWSGIPTTDPPTEATIIIHAFRVWPENSADYAYAWSITIEDQEETAAANEHGENTQEGHGKKVVRDGEDATTTKK